MIVKVKDVKAKDHVRGIDRVKANELGKVIDQEKVTANANLTVVVKENVVSANSIGAVREIVNANLIALEKVKEEKATANVNSTVDVKEIGKVNVHVKETDEKAIDPARETVREAPK